MARRAKKRRRRASVHIKVKPSVAREIWAIAYFAIGILMVLSLRGAFGFVGNLWIEMLKPIIGWGVYVLPGVLVLLSGMMFFSKKVNLGATRIIGIILFVAAVLTIFPL